MANYNLVAGIDQGTLELLSSQLYGSIYPRIFKGSFPVGTTVGGFPIDAVDFDVQAPPRFQLRPSPEALDALHAAVDALGAEGDHARALHDAVDEVVTFGLTLPKLSLTIRLRSGKMGPFNASIDAGCQATFLGGGRFVLKVLAATLALPGGPSALADAINKHVMPLVLEKLNASLAAGWQVPPIEFQGVRFGPPRVRTEDGRLLAGYSTLQGGGAVEPPAAAPWSRPGEFLLFDNAVANTATAAVFAGLQRSDRTKVTIGKWPFDLNIDASYEVGVRNPAYAIQPGNTTQVAVEAYGGGRVTVKYGVLPEVTLGLRIGARPNVLARFQLQGRQAFFTFFQVLDFRVDIAFDGVPEWLNRFISDVVSVLTAPIAQLIGALLSGLTVPVYQIPTIPLKVGDLNLVIDPDNLQVDTTFDGQKHLAAASGTVTVRALPGVTVPGVEHAANLYAAPESAAAE
ncbi:MAG TPA: hypothetical protein VHG91_02980 [Longimicrobium sp.]|nr:hypothetical protein [Longimicrobium sp.]